MRERPATVSYACWFAVAAMALGLVDSVRLIALPGAPLAPALVLATSLATVAIWGFIVYSFARGRAWARLVFVVITVIGIPGLALVFQGGDRLLRAVAFTQQASNLAAAILLLLPASSRWYREGRQPARPPSVA